MDEIIKIDELIKKLEIEKKSIKIDIKTIDTQIQILKSVKKKGNEIKESDFKNAYAEVKYEDFKLTAEVKK